MANSKRITANIPEDLLEEARLITGNGITETIIYGLQLVKKTQALEKARKLKGKLKLELDLEESRERRSS